MDWKLYVPLLNKETGEWGYSSEWEKDSKASKWLKTCDSEDDLVDFVLEDNNNTITTDAYETFGNMYIRLRSKYKKLRQSAAPSAFDMTSLVNVVEKTIDMSNKNLEKKIDDSNKNLEKKIDEIKNTTVGYSITKNTSDHAANIFNILILRGNPKTTFQGYIGESPILNDADSQRAKDSIVNQHEKHLVNVIFSILSTIIKDKFGADLILVNSEFNKWFASVSGNKSNDLMPDGFLAFFWYVLFTNAYANAPQFENFGDFALMDCIESLRCLFDGKKGGNADGSIKSEDYGEFFKYLEMMGQYYFNTYDGVKLVFKGVLFNSIEFAMITCDYITITNVEVCKWTTPGSLRRFLEFVSAQSLWEYSVLTLTAAFGVKIKRYSSSNCGGAFLGKGAFGRAFELEDFTSVEGIERKGHVLKVITKCNRSQVELELLKANDAHIKCPNSVIPVDVVLNYKYFTINETLSVAGYVMKEKGETVNIDEAKTNCIQILQSLAFLHFQGIYHGDARFQNVVRVNGLYKWIDFRVSSNTAGDCSKNEDIDTFRKSIGMPDQSNDAIFYPFYISTD